MQTKTIDNEIALYLTFLDKDEKESILGVIKSFLKSKNKENDRVSIEQYNNELDEAVERIKNGVHLTQEEVENQSGKW
ncbi:hypothetical protein L0657_02800 [Dyadobacter sp. CY345]|uniref:hypothetical protein n=1 Tax=Dyadobacter sp. CY345 TaxID=2909335 RepID=UPI001F35BD80|nr:hypothetical protein [Dyadobacter sp. CY345]MCF2442871.1 hypothetical protein [Dyadobacter sp. CY345]